MKPQFRCANCAKETPFTLGGKITLVCQKCGCSDIFFNQDIMISSAGPGEVLSHRLVKADEPFLGIAKSGSVWHVIAPPQPIQKELIPIKKSGEFLYTRRK